MRYRVTPLRMWSERKGPWHYPRTSWLIHDTSQRSPRGDGPLKIAYYYDEDAANLACDHLNGQGEATVSLDEMRRELLTANTERDRAAETLSEWRADAIAAQRELSTARKECDALEAEAAKLDAARIAYRRCASLALYNTRAALMDYEITGLHGCKGNKAAAAILTHIRKEAENALAADPYHKPTVGFDPVMTAPYTPAAAGVQPNRLDIIEEAIGSSALMQARIRLVKL